jgi:hypothetical protein
VIAPAFVIPMVPPPDVERMPKPFSPSVVIAPAFWIETEPVAA